MLASPGIPLYEHSPPAGCLSPVKPCSRVFGSKRHPPLPGRHSSPCLSPKSAAIASSTKDKVPSRPCLRPNVTQISKAKKKVVFADDQGLQLTHVRIMREPSDAPPYWSLRPPIAPHTSVSQEAWELSFAQPASDYIDFRRKIHDDKVSLENVIIKEKEGFLTGTIKVNNIDFEKEVFLRLSYDSWVTSEDAFCSYVDSAPNSNHSYSLFDTFSFRVQLPPLSNRLDFCVCFRCQSTEFWDSNNGCNYTVYRRDEQSRALNSLQNKSSVILEYGDPLRRRSTLWSEHASWHGPCDVPYW